MSELPETPHLPDKLPEPSFSLLVATFGSQAMVALGQIPNPLDGKTEVRPDLAKHAIDMLVIIQERTLGNLAPEEASLLENMLHQLRMAYVAVKK